MRLSLKPSFLYAFRWPAPTEKVSRSLPFGALFDAIRLPCAESDHRRVGLETQIRSDWGHFGSTGFQNWFRSQSEVNWASTLEGLAVKSSLVRGPCVAILRFVRLCRLPRHQRTVIGIEKLPGGRCNWEYDESSPAHPQMHRSFAWVKRFKPKWKLLHRCFKLGLTPKTLLSFQGIAHLGRIGVKYGP